MRMAKLNVTRAAEMVGVTRAAMRRAIASGRVRRDPDGRVDTEELERAGYKIQAELLPQEDDASPQQSDVVCQAVTAPRAPGKAVPAQAGFHASVSVHLELGGHQVELTLQDTDETRVLARMEALLKQFPRAATFGDDTPHGPRPSPMRQRIMTLLQGYPRGLTRKEIQEQLQVEPTRNLKDTLYGMVRQKLLGTREKGVYVLMSDKRPTKAS
jgi:hypothetical protein